MGWEHHRLGHLSPCLSSSEAPRVRGSLVLNESSPERGQSGQETACFPPSFVYGADAKHSDIESDRITPLSWHRTIAEAHPFLCLLKNKKGYCGGLWTLFKYYSGLCPD